MRCDLINLLLLLQEPTSEDGCIQQRESPPVFFMSLARHCIIVWWGNSEYTL